MPYLYQRFYKEILNRIVYMEKFLYLNEIYVSLDEWLAYDSSRKYYIK